MTEQSGKREDADAGKNVPVEEPTRHGQTPQERRNGADVKKKRKKKSIEGEGAPSGFSESMDISGSRDAEKADASPVKSIDGAERETEGTGDPQSSATARDEEWHRRKHRSVRSGATEKSREILSGRGADGDSLDTVRRRRRSAEALDGDASSSVEVSLPARTGRHFAT